MAFRRSSGSWVKRHWISHDTAQGDRLFPEASFGAALNCVGIAQQLRSLGARPVFICHPGFRGVFAEYGFPEYPLPSAGNEGQTDWTDFINRHQDAFRQSPLEQIRSYVAPTWDAIVDTAIAAEEPLRQLLAQLKPDIIALDNVVMFPAIANAGVPWVRIVSCAETELPDPLVPPYLSGCGGQPGTDWSLFGERYLKAVTPAHRRMNAFLAECGLKARPSGEFLESSPFLNLLLSPDAVRFQRKNPLDPKTHVYLNGCVRQEAAYALPAFAAHQDAPLVLTSFGSLGAMDVALIKRMIDVFASLPYRFIVNVGPGATTMRACLTMSFWKAGSPSPRSSRNRAFSSTMAAITASARRSITACRR